MKRTGKRRVRYLFFIIILLILACLLIKNSDSILKINYPVKYKEQVIKYSKESGTDPFLIFAIIKAESNFKVNATSHKNAKGLMQLMDATAGEIADKIGMEGFESQDLYNSDINIRIGCWHVSSLIKEFGKENIELVIAAYNGGSRNVKNWLKDNKYSKDGKSLDYIPFRETENFLKKVKGYYSEYKRLYENEI